MTFFAGAKDATAVVAYTMDYADRLASGETISTSVWSVTGGTEDSESETTTTTTIVVSAGTALTPIEAQNTVTTSAGQTFVRSVTIPVEAT